MWFAKVNVDGAVSSRKGKSSCGGVFWNDKVEFLGGFFANLGSCLVLEAELWAILYGLRSTRDAGGERSFWSQTWHRQLDSSSLTLIGHPLEKMVLNIKELINRNWQIYVSHILREGNEVTDCCASLALDEELGFHAILDICPDLEDIQQDIIQQDIMEVGSFGSCRC